MDSLPFLHELPFAKIIILREDIAEVIINEGIDMDMTMVEHYHQFLLSHLKSPFSLLVNKINSYSYTSDAVTKLATLEEINVMAIVSYTRATTVATEVLGLVHGNDWNMKIFDDRAEALAWLESK